MRRDLVTGRLVLIAPERRGSPRDFGRVPLARDASQCPFCPGRESSTSESRATRFTPDGSRWVARAFANLFPMAHPDARAPLVAGATATSIAATGDHEVIVETPEHDLDQIGRAHV